MAAIIIEGVLFVALLAAGGALLYWILMYFTPAGVRFRQTRNRRDIERAAELTCPIHGPLVDHHLARLANGSRVCPECFAETFHD